MKAGRDACLPVWGPSSAWRDCGNVLRSRLVRRAVGFNLVTLCLLLAALMAFSPTRGLLLQQRQQVLELQAQLVAMRMVQGDGSSALAPMMGQTISIRNASGSVVEAAVGPAVETGSLWSRLFRPSPQWLVVEVPAPDGGRVVLRESPALVDAQVEGAYRGLIAIFVCGLIVSVGLSLALALMIARPLRDLTAAAGRSGPAEGRIAIPDMTGRPDEIGRLSEALRSMVDALYDRIEANEQFAADVAHEVKNPLASLRSAVDTLRVAREDQRPTLMSIIDHDVRRLDRLVTDISDASRLDAELVKEEEEPCDLSAMLRGLTDHLGHQAAGEGVTLVCDLPAAPILLQGLEARLAQVFENLISNALSFSPAGGTVRVWAYRRGNRALIVVEDEGPGIPEEALTAIFRRFYSERPEGQFGDHSGLGLSISKQIVEAHRGVIWAENIMAEDGSVRGARFVVGLPA
nr:HAMP domain-containing sensor histidine kinase [Falsirhodobacter deserti]